MLERNPNGKESVQMVPIHILNPQGGHERVDVFVDRMIMNEAGDPVLYYRLNKNGAPGIDVYHAERVDKMWVAERMD